MSKHILVVDDDPVLRSLLRELLEDEAYEVDTASDGQIAWEKLRQQPLSYEVFLLDMNMPELNGLELIQALQQENEVRLQQIVIFSADPVALCQAVKLGVSHVLSKPFDLDELLEQISCCR